jgi:hypothetical protein
MDSWLNPLDRELIRKAVMKDQHEVVLTDGRVITITPASGDALILRVSDSLVPSARVKRSRVLEKAWVAIHP